MTRPQHYQKKQWQPNTNWVLTPTDGYFALLIAVIEQARIDSGLEPERYKDAKSRSRAQQARDSANWFMGYLEHQRKSIRSTAKLYRSFYRGRAV